mmetsp:Transcript_18634/g.38854  ORF Transcript_18634/g.38854 Transcript_18634/m.38854 type:complete len:110 (+) Transcript_18634:2078-2407(+)
MDGWMTATHVEAPWEHFVSGRKVKEGTKKLRMVDDWSWHRTKSMKWAILTNNVTHGEPRFCSIRRQEAVHPINQPRIRPNPLLGSLVKKRKKTRKNETKSIPGSECAFV